MSRSSQGLPMNFVKSPGGASQLSHQSIQNFETDFSRSSELGTCYVIIMIDKKGLSSAGGFSTIFGPALRCFPDN